ncbi:MAG: TorF family putative porin [Parachlamydiales bacterium]
MDAKASDARDCKIESTDEGAISEEKFPYKITGIVTFLSDYRSRGISQTFLRPAVQGEIKFTHENGFYFKIWASNVDGTSNFITNTSTEWNLFVGMEQSFWKPELKYDVGFIVYYYPGGKAFVRQNIRYNTVEYFAGFSYKGFNMKLYQTITDYYGVNSTNPPFDWQEFRFTGANGNSLWSPYIEANYEWTPCPKWTAGVHVGYQAITHYTELNYLDWQVSLNYEFDWFDVALYYISTNARHAFYDVPDAAFKPSIKKLGSPGIVGAIYREF